MPKISINILTKNRAELLQKALTSVAEQTFNDFEVVVVDDGSTDGTREVLKDLKIENLKIIYHSQSIGISASRQEALEKSAGEYVAVLDDDDEWTDPDKLKRQVGFLDTHPEFVLVGGLINLKIEGLKDSKIIRRPEIDTQIRRTMLLRNNFFTSTVMFRKEAALKAGGFIKDNIDLAEDYDLWLRMGKIGKMYNFPLVFTSYRLPSYNKDRFKQFLAKQLKLIACHKTGYHHYYLAALILRVRLKFLISNF